MYDFDETYRKVVRSAPPADVIGYGIHIAKLLEMAQAPEATRFSVVKGWNRWVAEQREQDKAFKLDLRGFNTRAACWQDTALWGNAWDRSDTWTKRMSELVSPLEDWDMLAQPHLILTNNYWEGMDFEGADFEQAWFERVDLTYAKFTGCNFANAVFAKVSAIYAEFNTCRMFYCSFDGCVIRGAEFQKTGLAGSVFSACDLSGSKFISAKLDWLTFYQVEPAYKEMAQIPPTRFVKCDLTRVTFENINPFTRRDWRHQDLTDVSFVRCDLSGSDFTGARLVNADFSGSNITDIKYRNYVGLPVWPFGKNLMLDRYLGIKGLDSAYGSPKFKRDAVDQEYIDQAHKAAMLLIEPGIRRSRRRLILNNLNAPKLPGVIDFLRQAVRWDQLPSILQRRPLFLIWSLYDYGRSLSRIAVTALGFVMLFGWLYGIAAAHGHIAYLHTGPLVNTAYYPWFVACMGFSTLGITDLVEPNDLYGLFVMGGNVLSGFITLGVLLAVIGNTFARRA